MQGLRSILARVDRFTTGIIVAALLGLFLPCEGGAASAFFYLTQFFIFLIFFFYGVKISRKALIDGILNWRLQLLVFCCTFAIFPLLVWELKPLFIPWVGGALYAGLLYLSCLPSTVQSSVVITSVAGGNIPAAVSSASLSNLAGVVITPLLVGLFFSHAGGGQGVEFDAILKSWFESQRQFLGWCDPIGVWLVVYTSFSEATSAGFWSELSLAKLALLTLSCGLILALLWGISYLLSRLCGFARPERITIVFCGSKKSLASGAPMMLAIFGSLDNNLLLPLMIYHQLQLLGSSFLARHWQKQPSPHA